MKSSEGWFQVAKKNLIFVRLVSILIAIPSLLDAYNYVNEGIAFGRSVTVVLYRDEDPFLFWFNVGRELIYALVPLYIGFFQVVSKKDEHTE